MTEWDGMSEDEVQRRLDEAFTRLRAVAAAEEHVLLEQMAADTPAHSWPPAPNTSHPSFERQAEFVRELIDKDRFTIYLPAPSKPLWRSLTEPPDAPVDLPPDPIALQVHKCWALAPWCGRPYVYMWRVAVEPSTNRWVSGDSWAEYPLPGQEWRAR